MDTKSVLTELHANQILLITISRPDALNALNTETLKELKRVFVEAIQSNAVSGIILTGEGEKAFVAGADIKELSVLDEKTALSLSLNGQQLFKMIEDCTKPVIAAVNGFALGGGCELAMACHIRIASENAVFGQPEVSLGIIPAYGGTQRMAQLVGRGKALELILTGDRISASEAQALGLVNHVVANRTELIKLATVMMNKILSKGPIAVANAIKSINAGFSFEQYGYTAEAESFTACILTKDYKEGTSAFIEKRQPNFKGE